MTEKLPLTSSFSLFPSKIFHIAKIKNKKKWTTDEDILLISLAEQYKEKHWKNISKYFQNKNPLQCFSRYKRIRPGIIKGSWSKEEDEQILNLVKQYGKSWSKIAKLLNTRNGKQIRDRFTNVLDPEIKKGKFSDEEDKLLIKLYISYGPKWAIISKSFPNRTADMIKNRFHSSIKKIFFTQDAITRQTKTMISLKEKKLCAIYENELLSSKLAKNSNVVTSGQCFSLQSTRPNSVSEKLASLDKQNNEKEYNEEKKQSMISQNSTNNSYQEFFEEMEIFPSDNNNLFGMEEYFTFDY